MLSLKEVALPTIMVSMIKVLLFPSYKSTDFEVHRNWLAITQSLPLKEWYYNHFSQWTLDYPPFFAYFECLLSYIAKLFDENIVEIENLNYSAWSVILFQRSTVVLTDLLLVYAAYKCSNLVLEKNTTANNPKKIAIFCLVIFNCGLIIIDHIHFQYNGMLFGILLLCIYHLAVGNEVMASLLFATLLNFKHIFIYIAPAFGVFLLKNYCFVGKSLHLRKVFNLAVPVLLVLLLSFGPFYHHILQVISRLFPFKRGLTHAYWAPNVWALYNFADKILIIFCKHLKFLDNKILINSSSSGLVQNIQHIVLPTIRPIHTFILTALSMIPCLIHLVMYAPKKLHLKTNQLIRAVVVCSLCSFMFGWHVHEKAILMAIIPFTLLAVIGTEEDTKIWFFLQAIGHYSLFPLLLEPQEYISKCCLALSYSFFSYMILNFINNNNGTKLKLLNCYERCFLVLVYFIELCFTLIYPISTLNKSHPFIPLMFTSVSCAIGCLYSFIRLYYHALTIQTD